MRIVSFVGVSGSGKTTVIEQLIGHFTRDGLRVAALKHTHHPVEEISRGDTARFLRAGAAEVILAGDSEAVRWSAAGEPPWRFTYCDIPDLLRQFQPADWLLVEGFKSDPPGVAVVVGELENPPQNTVASVPATDNRQPVTELAAFLDRIIAS